MLPRFPLNRNNKKLLIGSIAPDIAKLIGMNKKDSHFQDKDDTLPRLDEFLKNFPFYKIIHFNYSAIFNKMKRKF